MGKFKSLDEVKAPAGAMPADQYVEQIKLSREALEARRAYQREWRRRNKEKIAATQARYWEKKARQMGMTVEELRGIEEL